MSQQQMTKFRLCAQAAAAADKSDPFAYGRALAHLKCGIAQPSDFKARPKKKAATRH